MRKIPASEWDDFAVAHSCWLASDDKNFRDLVWLVRDGNWRRYLQPRAIKAGQRKFGADEIARLAEIAEEVDR